MNEIQQAQLQVLSLKQELKQAQWRLAFLQGVEAGKAEWAKAAAEREEIRQSDEAAQRAEAERQEKLRAAKASLAAVKANRTRRRQKAETLKAETLTGDEAGQA